MIPARVAPTLIALLVSGGMCFLVSGVATWRALDGFSGFFTTWMSAWAFAWPVAFPALLLFRPLITKLVMGLVREGS
ncbi:MAG: DUF2798 domain-containing protein [Pseudomonadota bacterium]